MAFSFLFGPVSQEWMNENLPGAHAGGRARCFDLRGATDLLVQPDDSWQTFRERFPEDWQPEALFLLLQYRHLPDWIWSAPLPIIALAGDWNLQWHSYRRVLHHCDLVYTDLPGVEVMEREGIENVRPLNLFGLGRSWIDFEWPDEKRDIDILFVGNFNAAVQRERLPCLARLAALRPTWNVQITSGVFGDEYRHLLARSRIVFNRSIRGECNCRVAETLAAGALLFQEAENREVPALLKNREECVFYTDESLKALLDHYLSHEKERQQIAAAGRSRVQEFTFERQLESILPTIEAELPRMRERALERSANSRLPDMPTRVWVDVCGMAQSDGTLRADLLQQVESAPRDARSLHALGVLAWQASAKQDRPTAPFDAAYYFQEAWRSDPRHVLSGLNLAEILLTLGQYQNAEDQALRTLTMLDQLGEIDPAFLDAPHVPLAFDDFRVEWERAAWLHPGEPREEAKAKTTLVRWRLHSILAQLRDDLVHAYSAHQLRPDLFMSPAWLGCALGRKGRISEAARYLRQAVAINPFDNDAAHPLHESLGRLGLVAEQERFARSRRQLAEAAPKLVQTEPWAAERPIPAELSRDTAEMPHRIVWHGSQESLTSLALVNREICQRLIERGHQLSLLPAKASDPPGKPVALPEALRERWQKPFSGSAEVHVSHQWPPDFTPPAEGHWIIMQPWEYGSLPSAWLAPMTNLVDEIWVPSHFVRDGFVRSGLPVDRVHVVPNGVSDVFLRDGHSPFLLRTRKRFKFLFVGGTIERKGIDLLLGAYAQTFCDHDDVCLVIKDLGVGTFYHGQTAEQLVTRFRQIPHAPEIEYLNHDLTDEEMGELYVACDCLVHPYRGEGFGLPIAEAMACGVPVLVTGYGAALDFCREEHAYLLPAQVARFSDKRLDDMPTVDFPYWAEPDRDALRYWLRHVVEHPDEAKAKAQHGQTFIRKHFTWNHSVSAIETRLAEVLKRPVKRRDTQSPATAFSLQAPAPSKPPQRYEPAPGAPIQRGNASNGRPRVSLTMIVKNEEANLGACLQSVADLVDEIIVVDTGSTDRTKAIAQSFGAKVYDFPWVDHFAKARNESLRHATGEWIFWMDADDRLDEPNRQKLRTHFAQLPSENIAFVMKCICVPDSEGRETVVDHVRLFRNHEQHRWSYRIHEQILPSVRVRGGQARWADVNIHHVGYVDRKVRAGKLQRDLRLLTLEHQEQPNDPFTNFNLAQAYQEQGRFAEALECFEKSLKHSEPSDSIVRKLYAQIIHLKRHLGRSNDSLKVADEAKRFYPDDPEILTQESATRQKAGDRAGAIRCLRQALERPKGAPYFGSMAVGIGGYQTRYQLACLLQEDGNVDEASEEWQYALDEKPDFLPALLRLAEVDLKQKNWSGLEARLERMRQFGPYGVMEAETFMAQKHFAEGNHWLAVTTVQATIQRQPSAIWPRILLSRFHIQEGRDLSAAEEALRDVLLLDPDNAEAQNNLEVIRKRIRGEL